MSTHNVWSYWDDYRREKPAESFSQYVERRAQEEADAATPIRVRGIMFRDEDDCYDYFEQRDLDDAREA